MIKKIINIIFVLLLFFSPAFADDSGKLKASMQTDFVLKEETDDVIFITQEDLKVKDDLTIPKGAVIYAKNFQAQRALRWHKSGCIICKVIKYSPNEFDSETIDISDEELYLFAKKYEKIYKKDAAILATEIVLTQGASFFAPGADILYFFTKGAIQREKNPNWFKAGVHNAYENSICWFWLKGKTINLFQGDDIDLKAIKKEKAYELKDKMVKRKTREDLKALKKQLKNDFKVVKKLEKQELKQLKKELKEEEKFAKKHPESEVITDEKEIEIKDVHAAVKLDEIDNINEKSAKKESL